jgi:hypothetical protein
MTGAAVLLLRRRRYKLLRIKHLTRPEFAGSRVRTAPAVIAVICIRPRLHPTSGETIRLFGFAFTCSARESERPRVLLGFDENAHPGGAVHEQG